MLETVFLILIAGCGHGPGPCEVLSATEISAPHLAACERHMDGLLKQTEAGWPEVAGVCLPSGEARLPEGWVVPDLAVAGGPRPGKL